MGIQEPSLPIWLPDELEEIYIELLKSFPREWVEPWLRDTTDMRADVLSVDEIRELAFDPDLGIKYHATFEADQALQLEINAEKLNLLENPPQDLAEELTRRLGSLEPWDPQFMRALLEEGFTPEQLLSRFDSWRSSGHMTADMAPYIHSLGDEEFSLMQQIRFRDWLKYGGEGRVVESAGHYDLAPGTELKHGMLEGPYQPVEHLDKVMESFFIPILDAMGIEYDDQNIANMINDILGKEYQGNPLDYPELFLRPGELETQGGFHPGDDDWVQTQFGPWGHFSDPADYWASRQPTPLDEESMQKGIDMGLDRQSVIDEIWADPGGRMAWDELRNSAPGFFKPPAFDETVGTIGKPPEPDKPLSALLAMPQMLLSKDQKFSPGGEQMSYSAENQRALLEALQNAQEEGDRELELRIRTELLARGWRPETEQPYQPTISSSSSGWISEEHHYEQQEAARKHTDLFREQYGRDPTLQQLSHMMYEDSSQPMPGTEDWYVAQDPDRKHIVNTPDGPLEFNSLAELDSYRRNLFRQLRSSAETDEERENQIQAYGALHRYWTENRIFSESVRDSYWDEAAAEEAAAEEEERRRNGEDIDEDDILFSTEAPEMEVPGGSNLPPWAQMPGIPWQLPGGYTPEPDMPALPPPVPEPPGTGGIRLSQESGWGGFQVPEGPGLPPGMWTPLNPPSGGYWNPPDAPLFPKSPWEPPEMGGVRGFLPFGPAFQIPTIAPPSLSTGVMSNAETAGVVGDLLGSNPWTSAPPLATRRRPHANTLRGWNLVK